MSSPGPGGTPNCDKLCSAQLWTRVLDSILAITINSLESQAGVGTRVSDFLFICENASDRWKPSR